MAEQTRANPLRWSIGAAHWWGLAAIIQLCLALPMALAVHGWMSGAIANRYEPGELFTNLSTVFRFDQRAEWAQLSSHNAGMGAALAFAAMLAGMFMAGGWASMAFSDEYRARTALHGGVRFFGRYFRVWLWTLVVLALWSWIMFGAPWRSGVLGLGAGLPEGDWDRMETFTSEWSAVGLRMAQGGIYVLGIAVILAVGDYARLRVAWRDACFVSQEYWGAWWLVISRPWRMLYPLIGVGLLEAALVFVVGMGARWIEGQVGTNQAGMGGVAALMALSVILVNVRCWCRGARYALAARVVEREVAPLPKPFAWARRVQ